MDLPASLWGLLAAVGFALAVLGGRGLVAMHAALRAGELARLESPPEWQAIRLLCAYLVALPLLAFAEPLAALAASATAHAALPSLLASLRRRIETEVLDDLSVHLDLVALAMEGGATLDSALAMSVEHSPPGALKRAWMPAVLEVRAGTAAADSLRNIEDRLGFRLFGGMVAAIRSAEKFSMPLAPVIRDKARQAATSRYGRAERRARAVPLKLWATMMLCLVPCTFIVLAFPVSALLARVSG